MDSDNEEVKIKKIKKLIQDVDEVNTNDALSLILHRSKLITKEDKKESENMAIVKKQFLEKLQIVGSAFSLAKTHVRFELFCDFPSSTWFSSKVVTAYCLLLNQRESALRKQISKRENILYLDDSFFFLCINNINIFLNDEFLIAYQNEKIKRSFESIFNYQDLSYDKIFLCANQKNNHWVLYEILVKDYTVNMYDSYNAQITPTAKLQFQQIQKFIEANSPISSKHKWKLCFIKCNYQQNDDDCGVFMLTFGFVLSDFSFEKVKNINCASLARLKIAMDITRGYIEDPRLEGYKYFEDAAQPSLSLVPIDYDRCIIDLTKNDEYDIADVKDNKTTLSKEKILELELFQSKALNETLQLKIDQQNKQKTSIHDEKVLAKMKADIEKEMRAELEKKIRDDLDKEQQIEAEQRIARQFQERDETWIKKLKDKKAAWKIEKDNMIREKENLIREKENMIREKEAWEKEKSDLLSSHFVNDSKKGGKNKKK
jgi:hypothetical protein